MPGQPEIILAVGTEGGGFLLSSGPSRLDWKSRPFLRGESVNSFAYDRSNKILYAATLTEGVFASRDLGRTWKTKSRGLHVRKVWAVELDQREPSTLYAGTHYGHLFRSVSGGTMWEEVVGLHNAPKRNEWGIDWAQGTTGLTVHTVRVDPHRSRRLYIVSSGGGPYRSDNGGESWQLLQNGVLDYCPLGGRSDAPDIPKDDKATKLKEHLNRVHTCTHKLVLSHRRPSTLYQQNHCGVFESEDFGDGWNDISPRGQLRHGFPIALIENGSTSLFVVPAFQGVCKKHNSCIKGQLAVYRREKSGWERLVQGLPRNVHTCVLRDGMTTDGLDEAGLYFGTTTGDVFASLDCGESWSTIMTGAGRIQGLFSVAV